MSAERFPRIVVALNTTTERGDRGYPSPLFLAQVTLAERYAARSYIPKVKYDDLKRSLNMALKIAWKQAISETYLYDEKGASLPRPVFEFVILFTASSSPQLHNIAGKHCKVEQTNLAHVVISDMHALLTEMLPLADLNAKLRSIAKPHEPKAVEDRKTKYETPAFSQTAAGKIKTLLEEITRREYEHLRALLFARYFQYLTGYCAAQKTTNARGEVLTPQDKFMGGVGHHFEAEQVVAKLVESAGYDQSIHGYAYVARPDHDALLHAMATQKANAIRDDFVYKNLDKLGAIIEGKGKSFAGEVLGHKVDLYGLTGELRVTFSDGSAFTVRNQVVDVVNNHGTQFNRFPLTFHHVVLADGQTLPRPSEQRMNTVFLGTPPA